MTAIALRPLRADDLGAAHALSLEAAWPHRREDWRQLLDLGAGIAAVGNDESLLGTAMWWPYGKDVATIGMVLVASQVQGRGIGLKMMRAALAALGPRRLLLHATDAGLRLYERLGLRAVGQVRQHQGRIAPRRGADTPATIAAARRDAAVALDARAFGAPRTALMAGLLDGNPAATIETAQGLEGFALSRAFGRGRAIGPVVARDEDVAIALVGALLEPGFLRVDIPAEATRLAAALAASGLHAVDTVTVMRRGAWPEPADPSPRRFALVSQALG